MSEENESPANKKHRVIHWNPDADVTPAKRTRTWARFLGWTLGGLLGLLLAAGVVIRIVKFVAGPETFQTTASEGMTARDNPSVAFVSRSKAELAHETAGKALAELRRLPQDHPVQLQKLILIEKAFLAGESLLTSREYGKAFAHFDALNRELDDFSRSVKNKQEARQTYDSILVKMKDLEIARDLAPQALENAFEAASAGRQFLNEGSFFAAKKTLDEGLAQLKIAEKALSTYVNENIWRGHQALTKGQRDEATRAFRAALMKSNGNEIALQGLKRAETIHRVHSLLQEGQALEAQGRYAEAADAYQKAFALDGFSAAAQEGQARSLRLERETKFDTAFTAAKAAFKRRAWAEAIAECENALKVYPQKGEVQAMLKAARENAHADAVQRALAKGYAHENQHEWTEARKAYDETLKLDPNQTEAKEGYLRTGQMIRTLLQFETLIERAEQRASRAEFQAAIREFNSAMAIKPAYLVNNDRIQQLHALLMSQNKPLDVTFQSDGDTWVSISNFRNLGKFSSTSVKILPGDYEVVGRRKGYQDVLLLLQVRNGAPPPTVTVACRLPTGKS